MAKHLDKLWLSIIVFLMLSLISGIIVLVIKQSSHQPVEISLTTANTTQYQGKIYIGGAVANPGFYPLKEDDTVKSLIQSAGLTPYADLNHLKLYIAKTDETSPPQKISLNHAEAWLLEALPGIGQSKAQAIVSYRNQNGPFQRIEDLLKVDGFGSSTIEKIKGFITVED